MPLPRAQQTQKPERVRVAMGTNWRSPESPDLACLIHANLAHGWEFGGIRTYQQLHVKLEVFRTLEST